MGISNLNILERGSNYFLHLEKQNQKMTAISYMVVSQLCYCYVYASIGYLRKEYATLQILYARMAFGLLFNTAFSKAKNLSIYIQDSKPFSLLIWRGIFGALAMIFIILSLRQMKISDAVVIQNLAPIWTNIMAIFLLGEQFSKKGIVCFFLGFSGILLLSRPDFIFHDSNNTQLSNDNQNEFMGFVFALLASLFVASLTITLKKLTSIYKCHNVIQQQYSYIVTIFATGFLLVVNDYDFQNILNFRFILFSFLIALIGWIGQLLYSRSFGLEKTSIISPITYTQSFGAFLIDIFIFQAKIEFTSILGSILIILGSLGVIL